MKVLGGISVVFMLIMISLNLYPSWSQHAISLQEPLLYGCLFCISSAFLWRSFVAINKYEKILWNIQTRTFDVLSFALFGCIIVTPVTHESNIIVNLHLLFTFLAISVSYLSMIMQSKNDKMLFLSSLISLCVGGAGFLIGFLTDFYTTGDGEFIVAFPLAVHIFFTKTIKL